MIIDRAKLTIEFQYYGLSRWIGLEGSLSPGESEKEGTLQLEKSIKEIIKQMVETGNQGEDNLPEVQRAKAKSVPLEHSVDEEWEKVKAILSSFEFKDEAQEYLNTTEYKMTIEAKQIINSKKQRT